ncbi:hypothetical protein HWI79_1945 [Cryptosporidium felis]|nr:hypothetical protein HWI79_1945 [Cryptosporidium felis]
MANLKFMFAFIIFYALEQLHLHAKESKELIIQEVKSPYKHKSKVSSEGGTLTQERSESTNFSPHNGSGQSESNLEDNELQSQEDPEGSDSTPGEFNKFFLEPKYLPEMEIYESSLTDLEFPDASDLESPSKHKDSEYEDQKEGEDVLVYTRLHVGGSMDIVSRRTKDGLEFQGIKNLDLCCTNSNTGSKNPAIKPSSFRNKSLKSRVGTECNCADNSDSSSGYIAHDLLELDALKMHKFEKASSNTARENDLLHTDIPSKKSHVARKLASYDSMSGCEDCYLCSIGKKCFYHRTGGHSSNAPKTLEEPTKLDSTTSPPEVTILTSLPSLENQNHSKISKPIMASKKTELKALNQKMNDLIDLVREERGKQTRLRNEVQEERKLLVKIVLDLKNAKELTQLYMRLTKLEMEISLARQTIQQLRREEEKVESARNMLSQYETRSNDEIELAKLKILESKESGKLKRVIDRLEKRKSTAQNIQIDVNKRLTFLRENISQVESRISDLANKKTNLENVIAKLESKEVWKTEEMQAVPNSE